MKLNFNPFVVASLAAFTAFTDTALAARLYKDVTTTDLNAVANWATTSGGATDPASIGTSDALRFNEVFAPTSGTNYTASLSANLAVGGIELDSGSVSGGAPTGNVVIPAGNTLTLNGASSADINYANGGIVLNSASGGSLAINANVAIGASQQWVTSRALTVAGDINLNSNTLSFNTAGSSVQTLSGVISGTGSMNKTAGGGTLALTNTANTFSGQVTLVGGTTQVAKLADIGNNSSLGTGSGASSIFLNGAVLTYVGAGGDTTNRAISLNGSSNVINNNSATGAISFTAANVSHASTAARTLTLGGTNTGTNTLGSILGDSGTGTNITTLTKSGIGTWVLTGANTYTGTTAINQGVLRVTGTGVLGGKTGSTGEANNIWFTSGNSNATLEFETSSNLGAADQIRFRNTGGTAGNGAQLKYIGTTAQVVTKAIQCDTSVGVRLSSDSVGGSVDFSGSWANTTGSRPIYLGGTGTGDNMISGSINANGSGTLTKLDSGKWIISGTNNTYTGATTVSGGTLLVNGSLGNTAVGVSNANTAFGGTGSIGGTLGLNAGSLFHVVDLNDPLVVSGTVSIYAGFGVDDLTGLTWSSVANNTPDTPYTLINGTLGAGVFDGLAHNSEASAYLIGDGRSAYFKEGSLQLVVIPEPTAALLGGLGFLALLRRRR